jgi:hypothetical protein
MEPRHREESPSAGGLRGTALTVGFGLLVLLVGLAIITVLWWWLA